ncbi:hypothetical protein [Neorhizobium alkalisoli]|uniref:hypothetical protein n=1 Tax=Neorhizobium alkalisoli TaxID=528178 RepID=UPI000CF84249|nr:hypothetical protein [Neorhizobium alkalisoli]
MADLPHPWDAYASYQEKLSKRSSVDDLAWGLESALDKILDNPSATDVTRSDVLARVVANGARRNRYDKVLIKKFVEPATESTTPSCEARIEVRSDIRHLQRVLSLSDFRMLLAVGAGEKQAAIAESEKIAAPALRARLARARALAIIKLAA